MDPISAMKEHESAMGLFGLGKDKAKVPAKHATGYGSALEAGRAPTQDNGKLGNSATRIVERLLDVGIDGKGPFDSAATVTAAAVRKGGSSEGAIDELVKGHLKLAATGGFVTSMGGFITMPVALPANVFGFYVVATRMVAGIASARGYDLTQPAIRSAVLLTLVGADADDLLKKAGVMATGRLSNLAVQRLPGPILMVVNKAVGFRLLATAGKGVLTRFGKSVPLVGGVIGAGLDTYLIGRIADHAKEEFPRVVDAPN